MKTRKITVFAIASILGAIALTGCGSVVESSRNVGHAQPATQPATQAVTEAATEAAKPAAEQSVKAESLSNTAQNNVAQSVSYDANANTVSYTQQSAPVQTHAPAQQAVQQAAPVQQAPAYQASTSAEQAAANNAIAYAGGNGYKVISSEAVQTNDGSAVYRFGIVPVDNAKAPAWYYYAGENFGDIAVGHELPNGNG